MAVDTKTIYEHTEPMLTDGPIVERYRQAAAEYNRMALASGYVAVPETLHAALYATRHGEADIRQAVQIANDVARSLADGLISLMLVCRLRQQFGMRPVTASGGRLRECGTPGEAGRARTASATATCTLTSRRDP